MGHTRGRVPALDGLRGLAVAAVVVNHLRPNALPGGWLGVDIFFVLSGYLITSLLLNEHTANGRIDLGSFYARRVRRLLPALVLLLLAATIAMRLAPDAPGFDDLRGDGFAALGYFANWHFIATGASYFNTFAPSPLRHLWSLSIEEQFYLLWPLVLVLVLRRRGPRTVAVVAITLATASAIAMYVAYDNGRHVSRAYFGTDTHAHGILLGCALAAIGSRAERLPYPRTVAVVGLAALAVAVAKLDGTNPIAYRGGIAGVALLGAAVIAAVNTRAGAGPAGWLLARKPLVGLGLISYGVYLWHWPVLVFLTSDRTGVSGWPLLGVQVGLTLALAILSFVIVERPIRSGWPSMRMSWLAPVGAITAVGVALAFVVPDVQAPFAVAIRQSRARSAEHAPILAAAGSAGPHRVMLVGDSVAFSLFPGLRTREAASDLYFFDASAIGCGLAYDVRSRHVDGLNSHAPGPQRNCRWPTYWPAEIARVKPDVVVALWGLWDIFDIEVGDRWIAAGSPEWSRYMEQVFEHSVTTLTAGGAHLVVLTTPYYERLPTQRVDALTEVFRTVAAARPRDVTVVDIHEPIERLHPERWDGIHYSARGADVLAAAVDPMIARAAPERAGRHTREAAIVP